MTHRATARRYGVSWYTVNKLVLLWAGLLMTRRRCRRCKVLLVDETSIGSSAYKAAIDRYLPHARHVLDRFHVIGWFQAGLTTLRCGE